MGGRLPGGFSIRGLSGGERRRLNIAAGTRGLRGGYGVGDTRAVGEVWNWINSCYHEIRDFSHRKHNMAICCMPGKEQWSDVFANCHKAGVEMNNVSMPFPVHHPLTPGTVNEAFKYHTSVFKKNKAVQYKRDNHPQKHQV